MGWNEDSLHRWMSRALAPRELAAGFGNDAAVLAGRLERAVLCVDQAIEGVHFLASAPQAAVARKACARALSDLAASGASPRAVLLALRAPRGESEARLRSLVRGVAGEASRHGAELVGGDTACAEGPLALTVTAVGELGGTSRPVSRSRAQPGQIVVATGPFGGSGLGRHLRIEPRFDAGRWLIRMGATAMMDVSDGLALDLARIARASKVEIALGHVPIHRDARKAARRSGRPALHHALFDGEDHELIATLPASAAARALREAAESYPNFALLGKVRRGAGLRYPRTENGGELVAFDGRGGWVHGA